MDEQKPKFKSINLKELMGDNLQSGSPFDNSEKEQKKKSGGIMGGLLSTGMAALPLIPKKTLWKYGSMVVGFLFIVGYGLVSLVIDIIGLF